MRTEPNCSGIIKNYTEISLIAPKLSKKIKVDLKIDIPKNPKHQKGLIQDEDRGTFSPIGLKWNPDTSSCSYDTLFRILHHIYKESPESVYRNYLRHLKILSQLFTEFLSDISSLLIHTCDQIWRVLNGLDQRQFPLSRAICRVCHKSRHTCRYL